MNISTDIPTKQLLNRILHAPQLLAYKDLLLLNMVQADQRDKPDMLSIIVGKNNSGENGKVRLM